MWLISALSRTIAYIYQRLGWIYGSRTSKIKIFIIDDLCGRLKWRSRHHTPALIVAVTDSISEDVVALEQLPGPIPPLDPPASLTTEVYGTFDHFLFIIGITFVASLHVLIPVTLFLLEK